MIKGDLRKFLKNERRKGLFKALGLFRRSEAAELLEFALALPLILVMLVGVLDFASAYHLKQILANAAREGARLAASEPIIDESQSSPGSVQAVYEDVTTYLQDAGVNTSFIGSSMSYNTSTGTATYYTTSGGNTYGLIINRQYYITTNPDGTPIDPPVLANQVTLICPYDWTYGFNNVIKLLIPSASVPGNMTITVDAAMPQL